MSVPLLIGAQTGLNEKKTIGIFFETGILGDFAVSDKSYKAPDRGATNQPYFYGDYKYQTGTLSMNLKLGIGK